MAGAGPAAGAGECDGMSAAVYRWRLNSDKDAECQNTFANQNRV